MSGSLNGIGHHPAEDILWDYYRGALKPGLRLVVRSHLEVCPHCRGDIALFDAVGSALFDAVEGVAMSDNALDLALARIERPETPVVAPVQAVRKAPAFLDGIELPQALKDSRIHGRYWVAPGVWLARVDPPAAGRDARFTYLLRVPPGMAMPHHTHRGRETTLVLKGSFKDGKHRYEVGDFVLCDDEDCHSPETEAHEDCICLIAHDAPILPTTWLGKVLQPFARI
jgi:putative transcriptional regulator